jgi:hypothetical protein
VKDEVLEGNSSGIRSDGSTENSSPVTTSEELGVTAEGLGDSARGVGDVGVMG